MLKYSTYCIRSGPALEEPLDFDLDNVSMLDVENNSSYTGNIIIVQDHEKWDKADASYPPVLDTHTPIIDAYPPLWRAILTFVARHKGLVRKEGCLFDQG